MEAATYDAALRRIPRPGGGALAPTGGICHRKGWHTRVGQVYLPSFMEAFNSRKLRLTRDSDLPPVALAV